MAKRLSESERIVKSYMNRSPKNFKLHISEMRIEKLNKIFDAFEEECEYEYIQICLDEFRRRSNV